MFFLRPTFPPSRVILFIIMFLWPRLTISVIYTSVLFLLRRVPRYLPSSVSSPRRPCYSRFSRTPSRFPNFRQIPAFPRTIISSVIGFPTGGLELRLAKLLWKLFRPLDIVSRAFVFIRIFFVYLFFYFLL